MSFVYDGYKLIEERNALDNNAAVRKYVWQPEVLDRDVPLTVYDVVSDKTYYFHTDANKNVTELSDESGNVVAHYEYSPFGSLTNVTGDYAASNPFRFSGEYFDEETGLVYYNYRYYNPELGRWISRDPIEEQGGYNLYGMIGNNPLCGWDVLGCNTALARAAAVVIVKGAKIACKVCKNSRRAARRSAMRANNTPTSRPAIKQTGKKGQRQYTTEGADGKPRVQTEHSADKQHPNPHFHDGKPKTDPRTGDILTNKHGQVKYESGGKSTVPYQQ